MFVYHNANTGQTVTLAERDPILDCWPNWTLRSQPVEPESAVEQVPAGPVRPPEAANKAAWVAYAVACGMPESDAKALSKASLIEEFGADADDDQEEVEVDGQS